MNYAHFMFSTGAVITMKNARVGGGYLHSHYHLYPEGQKPKLNQNWKLDLFFIHFKMIFIFCSWRDLFIVTYSSNFCPLPISIYLGKYLSMVYVWSFVFLGTRILFSEINNHFLVSPKTNYQMVIDRNLSCQIFFSFWIQVFNSGSLC